MIDEDLCGHTSLLQTSITLATPGAAASLTQHAADLDTEIPWNRFGKLSTIAAESRSKLNKLVHDQSTGGTTHGNHASGFRQHDGASKSNGINDDNPLVGDVSRHKVNARVVHIVVFVAGCAGFGYLISFCISANSWAQDRPPLWLVGMLVSCYALLIPALSEITFYFSLNVELLGQTFVVSSVDGKREAISESFFGFVHLLFETGGYIGAYIIILYGVAVPAFKLTLLALGELWRHSAVKNRRFWARRCILVVQFISKWACPDMFVYILMLYLFRHIDGKLIMRTPAHLDTGFTCFAVFCLLSTMTALAIKVPPCPSTQHGTQHGSTGAAIPISHGTLGRLGRSWLLTNFGYERSSTFAVCMAGLILTFLGLGFTQPCFGIRLNDNLFIQPHGPLPEFTRPLLDKLDIPGHVNADVSLVHCAQEFYQYVSQVGDFNYFIALVLLVGFVFVVTLLDVAALVMAAFALRRGGKDGNSAMQMSHILKHLSMLDVCIMGVVIGSLAGTAYSSEGVSIQLFPGTILLVVAEVCHYILYYTMSSAVEDTLQAN